MVETILTICGLALAITFTTFFVVVFLGISWGAIKEFFGDY